MDGVSRSRRRKRSAKAQFNEPFLVTEKLTRVIQSGESGNKSSEFVDLFSYLGGSPHLIEKIITYLDVKSLQNVLRVCKSWLKAVKQENVWNLVQCQVLDRNWRNGLFSKKEVKTSYVRPNLYCDWSNIVAISDVIGINDQWILVGSFSSRHFEVYDRNLVLKKVLYHESGLEYLKLMDDYVVSASTRHIAIRDAKHSFSLLDTVKIENAGLAFFASGHGLIVMFDNQSFKKQRFSAWRVAIKDGLNVLQLVHQETLMNTGQIRQAHVNDKFIVASMTEIIEDNKIQVRSTADFALIHSVSYNGNLLCPLIFVRDEILLQLDNSSQWNKMINFRVLNCVNGQFTEISSSNQQATHSREHLILGMNSSYAVGCALVSSPYHMRRQSDNEHLNFVVFYTGSSALSKSAEEFLKPPLCLLKELKLGPNHLPFIAYDPSHVSIGAELQDFVMDEHSIVQVLRNRSTTGREFELVALDFLGGKMAEWHKLVPCPSVPIKFCSYCKKPNKEMKRCSRCKRAYYCNNHCQEVGWYMGHRTNCSSN